MKNIFHRGTFIFLILILAGCTIQVPVQPGATVSENAAATATPETTEMTPATEAATSEAGTSEVATPEAMIEGEEAALVWQGNIQTDAGPQESCQQLILGPDDQALIGPCGEADTPVDLLPIHSQEWSGILDRFAPFEAETPEGQVIFRGRGEVAGSAWERAITAWARFTYQELQAGRAGASYKTVMSWWLGEIPEQPGHCAHLVVLVFGYAYANVDPCPGEAGGPSLSSAAGWLETEEWEQFDAWLYNNGQVYQGDNYFSGLGSEEMPEADIARLDEWARMVYARLAGAAESALSGCPEPTEGTELLRNEDHGYCLLYPDSYSIEQPTENETVILVGSLLDVEHPKLFIEVSPAEGRSAEEVADELVAEVQAAMPDYEVERTAGLTIDGEPATQLDRMPGQDLNRQVLVVHDDRLYKLTFVPADEQLGDIFSQMEELYNTVIESFRFLASTGLAAPEAPAVGEAQRSDVELLEPLATAARITFLGWSPDSETLAYLEHTAEDLAVPGPLPPGRLKFLAAATGQVCDSSIVFPDSQANRSGQVAWLADGIDEAILVSVSNQVLKGTLCGGDFKVLTDLPAASTYTIASHSPDRSLLLFTTEQGYWFYEPAAQSTRQLDQAIQGQSAGYSWSPDGSYLAISAVITYAGNTFNTATYVVDVATGQVEDLIEYESRAAEGNLPGPTWLAEDRLLIPETWERGPLLVRVGQDVVQVAPELFGVPAAPI